jgi:hypothetical protein
LLDSDSLITRIYLLLELEEERVKIESFLITEISGAAVGSLRMACDRMYLLSSFEVGLLKFF